jgi:hypothetical protein
VAIRWHKASETHRFKTGTIDLDETERLLEELFLHDDIRAAESVRLRRQARGKLARAFLNRAHDAVRAGDAELMRSCLRRAIALRPSIIARAASRWLARGAPPRVP